MSTSVSDESASNLDDSTLIEEIPVSSAEEPETEAVNSDLQIVDSEPEKPESSPGPETEVEE
jgi:hypothetical protein